MIIAIDGPAASGKSSTAHGVAQKLNLRHIDTGAMYRAITLKIINENMDLSKLDDLQALLDNLDLKVTFNEDIQEIYLDRKLLGDEIRSPQVTDLVADVSAIAGVRNRLLGIQREVAQTHDVVLEGRDIGTVVFPDADIKIYMVADARVRALRRQKDFARQGIEKSIEELEKEILERDEHNAKRKLAPMKAAKDAITLDTTELSIDDQIEFIVSRVETAKSNGGNLMTKKQDMDAKAEEVKEDVAKEATEETAEVSAESQDAVEMTPAEETPEAPAEEAVAETPAEDTTEDVAKAATEEVVEEVVEAAKEEAAVEEAPAEKVDEAKEEVAEVAAPAEEEPAVEAEPVVETTEEVAPEPEVTAEAAPTEAPTDTPDVSQGKRALMNDLFAEIKTLKLGETPEDQEVTSKESIAYQELLDHAVIDLDQQSLVKARIISVSDKEVMVDFGFKSEGLVPRHEFDDNVPEIGETIELFLERIEDKLGQAVLSKRKAEFMGVWNNVKQKYADAETVEGTISRRIKGGMVVNILGVDAFLPGSQLDVRPIRDFDAYVGKTFEFKIVKVNEFRKNIVVSRKELLEESLKEQRSKLLDEIEVGQILEGRIKNITDFGVFVDLGGIDGLLHITDLSWGRVNHPSEVVGLDEDIMVKVIDYDTTKQRVSLGLKQLKPHPWESVVAKYPEGTAVNGKVVSLANYGAFVELTAGVEGLVHISEISWTQHIKHPSDVFNVGDEIDAIVLSVDAENHKISLGVKQLQPDPWTTIEEKYLVGSVHEGTVRNLAQFGAFIELEEGIDGLVHISDLSWTSKVRHPKEIVNRGDKIMVKILDISQSERKISLGIKQAQENPWPELKDRFAVNTSHKGTVIKLLEKGVILSFPDTDVEGIISLGNFRKKERKEILDQFEQDAEVEVKVVEVDATEKKVVVSHESAIKDKERNDIDEFIRGQDHVSDKLEIPEAILSKIREAEEKPAKKAEKAEKVEKAEKAEKKPAKKKAAPKKKKAEKVEEVEEVEAAPEVVEAPEEVEEAPEAPETEAADSDEGDKE
ncbi:MAG: (d)CMP kinase [Candidatus Marinimicrobia bacterium]|jgi:small subunit ribosomal protein S1|nr:(d)CMP kinase [Candidatus Neomarinimicrobiota bacterium]MBT3574540.1 (d)CMP kinase [Candidatus Neomarinimicrobiota bacterium]MBT4253003.1 (d)CMP kinase [Candidatus Neomarinimicrobiota bacterium]MBT4480185.1 (d)CMP kinase [Candidatus Neomarinimicrobiota bacterium]MBT5235122.1 (d)CMP kinase [Candidatus Neomarinimicrobiota bacterium]